ncbi:MAG: glycosyltransferase family 4 protein [Tannerellaceae bacterium]|nr:glycosyltransferase family 4 protein [Tannerellaceae bacterium]
MRIGYDAKRAVQNHTGLGNYSRYVIETVSKYAPSGHCILFAPRKKENAGLKTILSRTNISFVFPRGTAGIFPSLWRTLGMTREIRKQRLDVYHGLSNELPFGIRQTGVKAIVTVHDLIFLRYPEYYKPADRMIYRFKFEQACRMADRIIAVSECTKRDIMSFFHIPEEKITVIYQGCHPDFGKRVSEEKKKETARKYGLPPCFILCVGSIEARKNLLLAVRALARIPDTVHLVAAGKFTPYQLEVERCAAESGVAPRLHILNRAPFEDLKALYQLATVFVYPSFFEGFGIPVIEALSSGIPVIAASGSCLEEAGGPGSIYVDPSDDIELAARITGILQDDGTAKKMIEAGKEYVIRFSEQHIASALMKLYAEVAGTD